MYIHSCIWEYTSPPYIRFTHFNGRALIITLVIENSNARPRQRISLSSKQKEKNPEKVVSITKAFYVDDPYIQ